VNLGDIILLARKFSNDRLASGQLMSQEDFLRIILNESVVPDFVGRKDWFFKEQLVTTQILTDTYVLQMPKTLQDVAVLILHTGELGTTKKLTFKDYGEFLRLFPDPLLITRGFPDFYTYVNKQVWFDRPVDEDYNIRMLGLLRPGKLLVNSDVPDWLDEDKHMLLVYGLVGFLYLSVEDTKNSQVWFNIYEQGVETFWKESESRKDGDKRLGKFAESADILLNDPINNPFVKRYNS
jgi:hypothetical protein